MSTGTQTGHETTPEAYAKDLASTFGDGAYLKPDGSVWVVLGDTFARNTTTTSLGVTISTKEAIGVHHLFVMEMRRNGWALWQEIVWAKTAAPPSGAVRLRCNPSHEYVLWFVRRGYDPTVPRLGGARGRQDTRRHGHATRRCQEVRQLQANYPPFPRDIPELIIQACTNPGDLVVDPFVGTGTTLTVAHTLGRNSIGFDIYDHVGLKRAAEDGDEEGAPASKTQRT